MEWVTQDVWTYLVWTYLVCFPIHNALNIRNWSSYMQQIYLLLFSSYHFDRWSVYTYILIPGYMFYASMLLDHLLGSCHSVCMPANETVDVIKGAWLAYVLCACIFLTIRLQCEVSTLLPTRVCSQQQHWINHPFSELLPNLVYQLVYISVKVEKKCLPKGEVV